MSKLAITGITISVDFGDKEYGKGTESFMNMSAKVPDPDGIPLEQIDDVIDSGLDMYFACWQTLLSSRFATGIIKAEEFNQRMTNSLKRLSQIRKATKQIATQEMTSV